MTTEYRKALDAATDNSPLWRDPQPFQTATRAQRKVLYVDMAIRGWERWTRSGAYRICLPCGLVWERVESADGRSWSVKDVTAE